MSYPICYPLVKLRASLHVTLIPRFGGKKQTTQNFKNRILKFVYKNNNSAKMTNFKASFWVSNKTFLFDKFWV